jgi:GT2 family glycosyltransferase
MSNLLAEAAMSGIVPAFAASAVRPATVSVIVCAYTLDRWGDLAAAVASLRRQSRPPTEIIVVIDHNPQLFSRVIAAWPDVAALENEEARGLSGARNTGVRAASGDVIAFLDDDAQAEPDWLDHLVAAYDDGRVLGVGGAILPAWEVGRPAWFPQEFDWVVGCTYKGMPAQTARQRNLIGANMSFRRALFAAVGYFQTDMGRIGARPLGCEETELCIRGAQKLPGAHYLFEPRARVHHRVPRSRATWRYFVSRCYSEGLSKAQVSDRVGAGDGLSAERSYTLRTLPAGVVRGFADALLKRDLDGIRRAAAIVAGLGITGIGYLRGRLAHRGSVQASPRRVPALDDGGRRAGAEVL